MPYVWQKAGGRVKLTGQERGVSYETNFEEMEVDVTVRKISTGETESVKYHCLYPPVFGYDKDDIQNVDEITDELIDKYGF